MSPRSKKSKPRRRGKPPGGFPRRRPELPPVEIPPLRYPEELPITAKRDQIVHAIREHQVVVVTGDTGSGKSTQLPKMCLEAGRGVRGRIGSTQPRRIAAVTLARRVAEELGGEVGDFVGFKIRFQERLSPRTRIKFMTDGILLAEVQSDRMFRAYDTVIIDEAHERSLNIDFLLGLLRRVLPQRKDLKVIITSATIDPESFSRAFGSAPIIEVSGRTYPVEVRYRPFDSSDDEITVVDAAVDAVSEIKRSRKRGDVLVFMPTESDIRETVARLQEMRFDRTVVLPLFGRLAGPDQERVFRPLAEEKIVVATNVAETSVTIPGIRYVVDTGLARLSMYNPRSRTQGLPVLPVSRASADQRKGRCGRVGPGICIRLYSEEDYLSRPAFTPPEIQRSNLAEVILRMLAGRLGDVRTFPFLDPPSPSAVNDGYAVLRELGAVDDRKRLTSLGRIMARFPLDPRLSRMLIQARKEGALDEMIIISAALSIQDPRERPMEQENLADQAHARFKDRRSDFLTLLNIWKAYQQRWKETGSRNQLRKFCREHFLSYRRMREWVDVVHEIRGILKEIGDFPVPEEEGTAPASYEAIHRCVLSGYLSHVALKKEKNIYRGTKGRQLMIFPGSSVFNKGGDWIVAAEIVQTSRLFARIVANVDPEWIEDLGKHLLKFHVFDPHWERRRGQVVAYEKATLYGLPVVEPRKVNYARYDEARAREIFIRSALVEEDLPKSYGFLEHNRKLRKDLETVEDKLRRREILVDDEAIFRFYDHRLPEITDLRSFERWLRESGNEESLKMKEDDLLRSGPDWAALNEFPDVWPVGETNLPLSYAFCPGEEEDGVTVTVPIHVLPRLDPEPFQWLVPGLLHDKVLHLLRTLPKPFRRRLVPIPDTARKVLERLRFGEGNFYEALSRAVEDATGTRVPVSQWDRDGLPDHLKMRFRVVDAEGSVIQTGRDLAMLQASAVGSHEDRVWTEARRRWERSGLTSWDFGRLPEKIPLGRDAYGVMRYAYPALRAEGTTVAVRLMTDPGKAMETTRDGLLVLYQWAFAPVLKSLKKDWVFPVPGRARPGMPRLSPAAVHFMGDLQKAEKQLRLYLLRELFDLHEPQLPDEEKYRRTIRELPKQLGVLSKTRWEEVMEVVRVRYEVISLIGKFRSKSGKNRAALERLAAVEEDVNRLVPPDFLQKYRSHRMKDLPRYLKGAQVRAERAYVFPEKDAQKWAEIEPFWSRYREAAEEARAEASPKFLCFLDEFRWMLEEYKLSVFAPEIKTRFPVSAKRLEAKWSELQMLA